MSKITQENSKMSPATDIEFMERACTRIGKARGGTSTKQQVWAVARSLRVSTNRAYEFLKGRARRVDGFEKDRARQVIQQIEAEHERQKNTDHLAWLKTTLAAMGEGDAEFFQPQIDALERALCTVGDTDRPVDISEEGV